MIHDFSFAIALARPARPDSPRAATAWRLFSWPTRVARPPVTPAIFVFSAPSAQATCSRLPMLEVIPESGPSGGRRPQTNQEIRVLVPGFFKFVHLCERTPNCAATSTFEKRLHTEEMQPWPRAKSAIFSGACRCHTFFLTGVRHRALRPSWGFPPPGWASLCFRRWVFSSQLPEGFTGLGSSLGWRGVKQRPSGAGRRGSSGACHPLQVYLLDQPASRRS